MVNRAGGPADPETNKNPTATANNIYDTMVKENPEKAKEADTIGEKINTFWSETVFKNKDGRRENDMLGE